MSNLKIYNTLTRGKQSFIPIEPGKVRLYVCGITAYDYCHLGHARVLVVFDMIQHWLRTSNLEVTYVRNITDIDDKIIHRATVNRESIKQLTQRFIKTMHEDAAALGIKKPDYEPHATSYIPQMLSLIKKLQQYGLAYRGKNGDVYFSVQDFPNYGKLSGKSLKDLRIGERVNIDVNKRHPLDFVLWKAAKQEEPSDVKWNSPWGVGRPGWHIECSAMSSNLLGKHFDIHGGGQDLQFPHHENEIAQSEGAHRHTFVNYWIHNGFIRVNNKKMSKSLGNFFTIRDLLKKYDPEVIRFFILRAHYRSPLNYSDVQLEDARQSLTRLYIALKGANINTLFVKSKNKKFMQRFYEAMNDDFNTPVAIAVLFDLANEINTSKSIEHAKQLKILANIIGLLQHPIEDFLKGHISTDIDKISIYRKNITHLSNVDIEARIKARDAAKKSRNFAEADSIRNELIKIGIILEDKSNGLTEWRRG